MQRRLPHFVERKRSPRGARAIVALCCLLLLLPVLNVQAANVARTFGQESEESRQPSEEERPAEDPLEVRHLSRRAAEPIGSRVLAVPRGANSCPMPTGPLIGIARARGRHELRNGVGGPLRL